MAVRNLVVALVWLCWAWAVQGCAEEGSQAPSDGALAITCAAGQLGCNGTCINPAVDSANCGGCGLTCPAGNACEQSACHAADGSIVPAVSVAVPLGCAAPQVLCGAACLDPTQDDANCGGCGVLCQAGTVCDLGTCRLIDLGCPAGRTLCDGSCVNLTTSPIHCGLCGTSCGAGTCVAGACSCTAGTSLCGGACLDLLVDPFNCGACGVACAIGQTCTTGLCACSAGQTLCGAACTDLTVDVAHCGNCETACPSDQLCSAGSCVCPTGLSPCSSGCQDLMTSATDCGICENACAGGQTCATGSCQCPLGQTFCAGTCVDLLTDATHCGVCETSCIGGQICAVGACGCPAAQTLCAELCTDTGASVEHCGSCDNACSTGQVCNQGTCECPEGQLLCAEACVDAQSDDLNCGACGTACSGGQTCQQGSCQCPEGQDLCAATCIDTASDDLNCGGCDITCGLGELCNESACQGGGLGDDGCEGTAQELDLQKVSIYQTVEVPIMADGVELSERSVDVVAGRDTLVRAFVQVALGWSPRQLSARMFLDDGTERTTLYTGAPQTITASSEDADRDSTFEFSVAGALLSDQVRYAVEIVECGEGPGTLVQSPRFPAQDGTDVGAITAGGLRIHIVPLRANGMVPDTSTDALEPYRAGFLSAYPVDLVEFTIGEEFEVADAEDWNGNLDDLRSLRDQEGPDDAVYYYGMMQPTEDIRDFCGGGCTAGIGYVPNGGFGGFQASGRVSMGLAYGGESSLQTMLHEVGHNHGRSHAPCVPPGSSISGVDPDYPYQDAAIGVYGYDIRNDSLILPDTPDIMAYCDDPWFSDYTYAGLLDTVLSVNQAQQSQIVPSERIGDFWVLLLEPNRVPRWGNRRSGVVASGVAEPASIVDASGVVVETVDVYRTSVADIQAFSIEVPEPQPGWHGLRVQGAPPVAF